MKSVSENARQMHGTPHSAIIVSSSPTCQWPDHVSQTTHGSTRTRTRTRTRAHTHTYRTGVVLLERVGKGEG